MKRPGATWNKNKSCGANAYIVFVNVVALPTICAFAARPFLRIITTFVVCLTEWDRTPNPSSVQSPLHCKVCSLNPNISKRSGDRFTHA